MTRSVRRRLALVVFVAFIVVPLAELYVLIQVGQWIGVWPTIGLLILDSVLGTWLIKREGARAWRAMRERLETGRMPAREVADGALIVLGGALMLSPGFVTDVGGILLILPFTRPFFRRLLTTYASRRVAVTGGPAGMGGFGGFGSARPQTHARPGVTDDSVVRGEVIDEGP